MSVICDKIYSEAYVTHRADGPDGIQWAPSIDQALVRAKAENKPIFMQFAARFDGQSNAPYC